MGKHEASPKRSSASGGRQNKKRHIGLWIALALVAALIAWVVWFLTATPDQGYFGDEDHPPVQQATDPAAPAPPDQTVQPGPAAPTESTEAPKPPKVMKEGFYTFLLAGTTDSYNTDTMMLCSVDTKAGTVKLVSINRDTQVDAPISIPKINGMYGWEGPETMCRKVTELTGIPINDYVVINMNSFIKVIDMIGGVDYTVPYDMIHRDADFKYDINLPAGRRTLTGKEAIQFVRFRSTSENDFGRVNRQKDFLIAAVKQVMRKFSVSQIEEYIEIFNENVKTSMSVQEMVWFFVNVVTDLDFDEDVTSDTLPYDTLGYWQNPNSSYKAQSYVYLDPQQIVDYVNANLNPYTTDLTVEDVNIPRWMDYQ